MNQYEERSGWRAKEIFDKRVKDIDMLYARKIVPTGNNLSILTLSAKVSLTHGLRYISKLGMQHHNY